MAIERVLRPDLILPATATPEQNARFHQIAASLQTALLDIGKHEIELAQLQRVYAEKDALADLWFARKKEVAALDHHVLISEREATIAKNAARKREAEAEYAEAEQRIRNATRDAERPDTTVRDAENEQLRRANETLESLNASFADLTVLT